MDTKELIARGHVPLDGGLAARGPVLGEVPENTINCGCPDKPSESIAAAQISEITAVLECSTEEASQLRESHRRMLAFQYAAATGSGSWAKGCYPEYPNNHAWRKFYETHNLPAHLRRDVTDREWDEVVVRAGVWSAGSIADAKQKWGTEDYIRIPANWNVPATSVFSVMVRLVTEGHRRIGLATILADDGPNGKHNQHGFYEPIPGSTIGLGYFPPANSCTAHVRKIIDRGWDAGLNGQCKLDAHEDGHTMGLRHEFNRQNRHHSVMSYDWLSAEPFVGWRKEGNEWVDEADASIPELTDYFGGQPVETTEPEPDPDPPTRPPSGAPIVEDIVLHSAGQTFVYETNIKGSDDDPLPPPGV